MCKHTPSTDVKPKLPAGDTGLEDIPQAQISPEEEGPPLGEIAPEAEQPEAEEESQDEGQEVPSNEEQVVVQTFQLKRCCRTARR